MKPNETFDQLLQRVSVEIRTGLRMTGRRYLRHRATIDGLRITIGAKESEETIDEAADLPEALRVARPASRSVYRALRDLRGEHGTERVIMPADVEARMRDSDPDTIPSIDTINHALRDLRDREIAWSHPERGWVLGREQKRLPFLAGQSERPSAAECRAYAERMAASSVRRFSEGSTMAKQQIWVPAESSEYGVAVIDCVTEGAVMIRDPERISEVRYETRTGRMRTVPAARGEFVRVDGKLVIVRFPAGEVSVPILGNWQLNGLKSPEVEPSEVSA